MLENKNLKCLDCVRNKYGTSPITFGDVVIDIYGKECPANLALYE